MLTSIGEPGNLALLTLEVKPESRNARLDDSLEEARVFWGEGVAAGSSADWVRLTRALPEAAKYIQIDVCLYSGDPGTHKTPPMGRFIPP